MGLKKMSGGGSADTIVRIEKGEVRLRRELACVGDFSINKSGLTILRWRQGILEVEVVSGSHFLMVFNFAKKLAVGLDSELVPTACAEQGGEQKQGN